MFAGQKFAERFAAVVHATAEDGAVGPGEIDVFKNTVLLWLFRREVNRFKSGSGDAQHFARLDLADILRVEQIESASFTSNNPGSVTARSYEFAQIERAETARIAYGVEFFRGKNDQRIGAFTLVQGVAESSGKVARLGTGEQMHHDFGVAVGLKNRAAVFQLAAPLGGVGKIAVVADGDFAFVAIDQNGLRVEQCFVASSGIARV